VRQLLLVIEVLSPTSSRRDRVQKRDKYLSHGAEYWIVDADARVVERWRPGDDRPQMISDEISWQPADGGEPFRVDLVQLFAEALDS
jgi:Uma2 family endonuclease